MSAAPSCSEATAKKLTVQLREATDGLEQAIEVWGSLVIEAYDCGVWVTLGFKSWADYIATEVPGLQRLRVERPDRRELVTAMTEAGMSTRAIGSALGVADQTVRADQQQVRDVTHLEPKPVQQPSRKVAAVRAARDAGLLPKVIEAEVVEAEVVEDEPAPRGSVTGIDGKRYTRPPVDVPAAKPRRRPLPDAFREAVFAAQKDVGRLRRLVADDRFAANRESLTGNRYDLARTLEALHEVHDAVTGSTIASDIVETLETTVAEEDLPDEVAVVDGSRRVLDGLLPEAIPPHELVRVDLSDIDRDRLQWRFDELVEAEASIRWLLTAMQRELCRDARRRVQELGAAVDREVSEAGG